jgi:hypothetical protein
MLPLTTYVIRSFEAANELVCVQYILVPAAPAARVVFTDIAKL